MELWAITGFLHLCPWTLLLQPKCLRRYKKKLLCFGGIMNVARQQLRQCSLVQVIGNQHSIQFDFVFCQMLAYFCFGTIIWGIILLHILLSGSPLVNKQESNGIFTQFRLTVGFVTPFWKAQHAPSFKTGSTFVSIYSIGVGVQGLDQNEKTIRRRNTTPAFPYVNPNHRLFRVIQTPVILQTHSSSSFLSSSCRNCAFSRSPPVPRSSRNKVAKWPNERTNEQSLQNLEPNQSSINRTGKQSHTEWESHWTRLPSP